jgi:hypothetical protein
MMELIERAIPVIQHPPEARDPAGLVPQERPVETSALVASTAAESPCAEDSHRADEQEATGYEVALAGVHAALERLRLQHAQLTSGAVLQTYHRQVKFDVEDSRPATKPLSVKG